MLTPDYLRKDCLNKKTAVECRDKRLRPLINHADISAESENRKFENRRFSKQFRKASFYRRASEENKTTQAPAEKMLLKG